jgi:hypothetical protein
MTPLSPDHTSKFLERFVSFNDALLRSVTHSYFPDGTQISSLSLSAKDIDSSDGWSNVTLVIFDVKEIVFREGPSTRQILSDGLSVKWIDGRVWCDFSPYASNPQNESDFRRSDLFVAGTHAAWTVGPYTENVTVAWKT